MGKIVPSRKHLPKRETGRRKGFEMLLHNHKGAKTAPESGSLPNYGERKGFEPPVNSP